MIPKANGKFQMRQGTFRFGERPAVALGGFSRGVLAAFEQRTGLCCAASDSDPQITLIHNDALPREGYRIAVAADGIIIEAAAEIGVIWALTTVVHYIQDGEMPCFALEDAPRYRYRAQSLDVCRHFFSAAEVKRVLEQMALVKMNALHWHLTDDQAWRIEILRYPQLAATSGDFFTQQQIREIVQYAAERGITIVPEIDLPGHTRAALCAMPELGCFNRTVTLAGQGGIFSDILCAGKERTYEFVERVMDEIIELFPSPVLHIGGDEAPKARWKKCPDCNAKMAQEGLADCEALQGYFQNRVTAYLKTRGRTVRCWDDVLNSGGYDGAEIQFWLAGNGTACVEEFSKRGGIVYSEMFHLYLDYPCSMTPLKRVYTYTPKIGRRNMAADSSTLGIESCLWCERIETEQQLEQRLFPRLFAVAEAAWTTQRNYNDFVTRLEPVLQSLAAQGIGFVPVADSNPTGKARKESTLAYFQKMQETTEFGREETGAELQPGVMLRFVRYFFRLGELPAVLRIMKSIKGK